MKKELTIKEQIKILKEVKEVIGIHYTFICTTIFSVSDKILGVSIPHGVIWQYIPIMKKDVVTEICVKYGIKKPSKGKHKLGGGWWDVSDNNVRIKVIDALINELKKKI